MVDLFTISVVYTLARSSLAGKNYILELKFSLCPSIFSYFRPILGIAFILYCKGEFSVVIFSTDDDEGSQG